MKATAERYGNKVIDSEIFYSLQDVKVLIEQHRRHYNAIRTLSALGFRSQAPHTLMPFQGAFALHYKGCAEYGGNQSGNNTCSTNGNKRGGRSAVMDLID